MLTIGDSARRPVLKSEMADAATFNNQLAATKQNQHAPARQTTPQFALADFHRAPPPPPPAPAPRGQTQHQVKPGEQTDTIAKQYGLTPKDVILSEPDLAHRQPKAGETLTILADKTHPEVAKARREIAGNMAATNDPEKLSALAAEDIELTTLDSATPKDLLDGIKSDLVGRRPGDKKFAEIVDEQSAIADSRWLAQGRTHKVFDPLQNAAQAGDWQKVKDITVGIYATFAKTNPNAAAIAQPRDMLLAFGPDDARFKQAVKDAEKEFLVEAPRRAADEVRKAYQEDGAFVAGEKLREVTNPQAADPLTASTILKELEPTVMQMIKDYNDGSMYEAMDALAGAISIATDNASRTGAEDVKQLVSRMAAKFIEGGQERAAYYAFTDSSVKNGDGVILPLEMAAQLRASGDTEASDHILGTVLDRIEDVKEENRDLVRDLIKTAAPLISPMQSSQGYLREPTEAEVDKWFADHPTEVAAVNEILGKINTSGYELARIMGGLERYQPQFKDSEHHQEILDNLSIVTHVGKDGPLPADQQGKMGEPGQHEPELAQALSLSEEGMIEVTRELNMEGGQNGTAYNPYSLLDSERSQTIADPSWPVRMVRNHIQSDIKALTGAKPANVGLSMFGVMTYGWGVKSHGEELLAKTNEHGFVSAFFSEDGWRNAGFVGMYLGGIGIEGVQVLDAARRNPGSAWSKGIFNKHLKAFGWWNVAGTLNYIAKGDWARAAALGPAAAGTLWSTALPGLEAGTSPLSGSWLGRALQFGGPAKYLRFAGPVATLVTLAGSAAIWGIDQHERVQLANLTEPYAADWYARMGVPPEVARHLGNNDKNGVDAFSRFDAIIEQTGMDRKQFMDWLVAQGDDFVGRFIEQAVHPVEPDDKGNYRMTADDGDIVVDVDGELPLYSPRIMRRTDDGGWLVKDLWRENTHTTGELEAESPRSIKGIAIWAELEGHPMPIPTS